MRIESLELNLPNFGGLSAKQKENLKTFRYYFVQVIIAPRLFHLLLVGAFLKKRVDYSHGFSSVFFKTT